MWSAVCSGSPHSHTALSVRPHFSLHSHAALSFKSASYLTISGPFRISFLNFMTFPKMQEFWHEIELVCNTQRDDQNYVNSLFIALLKVPIFSSKLEIFGQESHSRVQILAV